MLGGSFDNLYESINASVASRMFEVIHIYPSREVVESEIVRIRQVLPKARESIQRVRVVKLIAEDIDKLGIRAVGFENIPEDGAKVFVFDSEEHPAEDWGMQSVLIKERGPRVGDKVEINRGAYKGKQGIIKDVASPEEFPPDGQVDVEVEGTTRYLGWDDIHALKEAKVEEADKNKVDRVDAEQTMKPQEEDSEVMVPDHMEDYSKDDEEEKGSKSKGTENELTELPDEKLDHEVKYESIEPLHLCNACFKTFRSISSKCTECESDNVERLVEEEDYASDIETAIIAAYEKARAEGRSREEAIQRATKASGGQAAAPDVRNLLNQRGVGTVEIPVEEEKGEVTHLKNIYNVKFTKDGEEEETRYMGFDEADVRRRMEKSPSVKVIDVELVKEGKVEEQDFSVAGKGIVDKTDAEDLARDKGGLIVPDDEDQTKFQVIVKDK